MKIKLLTARPILDSRGAWTLEATLVLKNGVSAVASVPEGKSVGSSEARVLPVTLATRRVKDIIAPRLKRVDLRSQAALDAFLNKLDGTPLKSKLGANAILAISIAFARATAETKKIPLWKYIREISGLAVRRSRDVVHPRLFINVINGGLHAGNNLDFQEYLAIPKCRTIRESVTAGVAFYQALGGELARTKGKTAKNLGDEGGYAPNFKDNFEPFRLMRAVVKKMKLSKIINFGMDAAATDIHGIKKDELVATYTKLIRDYGLIYIEDPFKEEAFNDFAAFTSRFDKKLWIAGDDLTTTNTRRMERAHAERSVSAVIIKPNQIGSVTEALDAVRAARKYGWAVIASHRSGETNDDFIADFAYGVGADGLKLGSPARGERVQKYDRLLEIEAREA